MSYATLLDQEGINSQFLVILKPRRKITSWTLVSGTKYISTFSLGNIISIQKSGVEQTQASSNTLSDGVWYYDFDTTTLTVDFSANPNSLFIVCKYEMYLSTFDAHFYRVPTDNTTRVVYYEPLVVKSPTVKSTVSDTFFGFLPTQSSSLILSNVTQFFQEHLYQSSFHNVDCDIYHYLDELTVANVKLLFRGTCKNINYDDKELSIQILDRNEIFSQDYRNTIGTSFYAISDFPTLDPNYQARPIRNVFGVVDGFIPVDLQYVVEGATTSDNRIWSCIADETNLGSVSTTVPASPACTATRTYLTSVTGFRVGDSIWIDSHLGAGSDAYAMVTAVGANYVDHTTVGVTATSTDVVKRSFVGSVTIYKELTEYKALYGRDYTEYTDATNKIAGFQFSTSLEANLGLPSNLTPIDLVHCRIYGHKNTSALSGSGNSTTTGNLTNGIVFLYEFMKTYLGIPVAQIDATSIAGLVASHDDECGFAIPEESGQSFPEYKEILTKIANTLLLKIYLNDDNKWDLFAVGPMSISTKTVEDADMIVNTFSYVMQFDELYSKIVLEYAKREISETNTVGNFSFKVYADSDTARYLHGVEKQNTFHSYHFIESEAQTLANRLSYIFGDRHGLASFDCKNRFFDTTLSDIIDLSRDRLLGYSFTQDVLRTRTMQVTSIDKSLNNVTIEISDNKGIEENSGSW